MKKLEKVYVITLSIFILLFIIIFIIPFLFGLYIDNIEYDVKITKSYRPVNSSCEEALINTEKKKVYIVKGYPKFPTYIYELEIKKLSDEQIEKLNKLYDSNSNFEYNYEMPSLEDLRTNTVESTIKEYFIKYKDKTINVDKLPIPEIEPLLNLW